ncbi:hypothetical protein SESBI_34002 [Sesbania bispinosa]|nr:hypothetical protein SESBI_34002 [Sesbania bispinosa]
MISSSRCTFLSNSGLGGSNSNNSFSGAQRRRLGPLRVVCLAPSSGDRNGSVVMETPLKEMKNETTVPDVDDNPISAGGPQDVYGEDRATEDQYVTPWHVSVASGYTLLRDPHFNKGLAFTEKERDAHYLRGLLPPTVIPQETQVKKMIQHVRQYQVPLQKYMAMMDLQERNERLFYKLLIDHVEELLPIVYTPTVGEACQKYGSIFMRPQGLYISLKEKGRILEVLRNWPEKNVQVIVVTDGERILGLGDLGCQGMGIPVGKLSLYTALGGVRPSACLPITIDVGTNNEKLLNDELYIGLKQRRATGQEYAELMHEFMTAVKQNYGEKVLIQFEDFANHNAFDLLEKYRSTHLVFNDDIQGTASVVLAGLVAALKLVGGNLADHRFLFLGAGEKIKPTVLIGTSGQGRTFTKEVIEAMASINEVLSQSIYLPSTYHAISSPDKLSNVFYDNYLQKPIILSLSNPTSQSECTAEEAYKWSQVIGSNFHVIYNQGRAIFASGSPFPPVQYDGKVFVPGQANNAYIFPGFGLGLIMSGTIRVHDDLLLAASEALAEQVSQENFEKGLIYPPFTNIRKISAHIAAKVAAKAYELGLATRLPQPKDLVKFAESCMYTPAYRSYR